MATFVYVPPPVVVTYSRGSGDSWLAIPIGTAITFLLLWGIVELLCWMSRISDRYDAIKARKRGEPMYSYTTFWESPTLKYWFMTRRWFRRKFRV